MLRKLLETVTGVHTGSDMPIDLTIHAQTMGLIGEETVCDDNLVWITKTHYPGPLFKRQFES